MNQIQFSNGKNAAIKLSRHASIYRKDIEKLDKSSRGNFNDLICVMKYQDQNLEKRKDVYVNFIDKWRIVNNNYNQNWKQELFKLYEKESIKKRKEINDCLSSYIMLADRSTIAERYTFKVQFYRELRNYFIQKYLSSPQYQANKQRSYNQMKLELKNADLLRKKQKQINRFINSNQGNSLLSYFSFKWFSFQNKGRQNQMLEQQEAESFLSYIQ